MAPTSFLHECFCLSAACQAQPRRCQGAAVVFACRELRRIRRPTVPLRGGAYGRVRTHTIRVNAKYRRPEQRLEERAPFTCAGDRPGPRPWKERAFDSRLLHAATCGAPASSSEDLRSRCSRPNSCPPARRTPSLEQARAPRPGQDTVSAGFSLQGGKLGRTASTCPCAPPMA